MILFKEISSVQAKLHSYKKQDTTIGFVPTMGALHKGHLSLIELSKKHHDITVCSIFINPVQFHDQVDFKKYPVTIEKDILLLEQAAADILFLPSVNEIYPEGRQTLKHYDLDYLETILEGKYRPGHFQGVCNVVHRLLAIIQPHQLFLGQKDYQQCLVIKRLIHSINFTTGVVIAPTVREEDGLAMSSRNLRLSDEDRQKANTIYKALLYIKANSKSGNIEHITKQAAEHIYEGGFNKIDYIEIVDAFTLKPVADWNKKTPMMALIAAFLNDVRLIDNMMLQD